MPVGSAQDASEINHVSSLNVIHVVSRQQRRGAETVAVELADEMARSGVISQVYALGRAATGEPVPEVHLLSNGFHIHGTALVGIVAQLRNTLRTHRPDVVLAHGGQATLVSVLAARTLGVPVVWQRILELPEQALRGARNRLWRFVARRVAGVIAITPFVAEEVRRLGFRGPIQIEPNHRRWARFADLDQERCRAELRREIGVGPADPVVGFVGHLVEQKRPQLAVEVLRRLDRPEVRLVVAGAGPLHDAVRSAADAAHLSDRVISLGHRSDVPELLAGLDALVVTSHSETMTGTVIEAQMAGCPVVSFQLDGVDTVVADGETGNIVPMDALDEMAVAVSRLLADPARRNAIARAARTQGRDFSTEESARRYVRFLAEVANGTGKRPRVLFLMPNLGVGGAERALLMIARHAKQGGFEPVIASLGPPRRRESETILGDLRAMGVEVHDLGLRGRADRSPLTLAQGAVRLRGLCRRLGIDIIDSCLFEADLVARFAVAGTPVRHVVHLVNTPYDAAVAANARGRGAWRFRAVRAIDSVTGRLTDKFVAITDAVADAAIRDLHVPRTKLDVVPRGVDLDQFSAPPVARDEVGALRVLSVGRLVPQKDHRTAVAAVRKLREAGVPIEYTVAGEGPLAPELDQAVEDAGLHDTVTLLPPTRDVVGLHRSHHLFCFPSLWEGQGNALIEAMACARPIVASDIPVLREVVGDAGVYFRPGDSEALAARLREVAAWPAARLNEVGAEMRARAEQHFAAPLQSKRLGEIYRQLLTGGRQGSEIAVPSDECTRSREADSTAVPTA